MIKRLSTAAEKLSMTGPVQIPLPRNLRPYVREEPPGTRRDRTARHPPGAIRSAARLPPRSCSNLTGGISPARVSTHRTSSPLTSYQWQDNLSWIVGRHTIKFGGEVWRNYGANFGVSPSRAYGSISFTSDYSGYSYADFLLGIPPAPDRAPRRDSYGMQSLEGAGPRSTRIGMRLDF